MKTLILYPLPLILFSLFCFSCPMFGGERDSLYTLEVDGKILIPENDSSKNYMLELLSDNVVLESGMVVDNEPFLLRVKKNSLYTIRITKEGYTPLVVSLNTNVNQSNYRFRFDGGYFMSLHGFHLSLALRNLPVEH